jgi:hypothetical protein
MNTLQIGCVAGLLLLEDLERSEKKKKSKEAMVDSSYTITSSLERYFSYFVQQPQNIQDVSYFFRRIAWFNRRKYCETGQHHEAEY